VSTHNFRDPYAIWRAACSLVNHLGGLAENLRTYRSQHAAWFCKEPSPGGRGGKMLEETLLDYALMRGCAQKSPAEHASLNPLCVQFWHGRFTAYC